jgi:TetR/AcrR family transcriptional regulator, transcriptional repressor for nem operon
MSRVSKEQSVAHRKTITEVSARLMRERGIKSVSVADLMGAAGLTHGGFYGHFESKDALAAEACAHAFGESVEKWKKRIAGQSDDASALKAIVDGYLSVRSRDAPSTSCPLPALVSDVAREAADAPVRPAYAAGTEHLLDILSGLQDSGSDKSDRRRALAQLSTLVGALLLARATAGSPLSEEILAAAREALLPPAPGAASKKPRH